MCALRAGTEAVCGVCVCSEGDAASEHAGTESAAASHETTDGRRRQAAGKMAAATTRAFRLTSVTSQS